MRLEVLTTEGAAYIPFAKQKLRILSNLRKSLNVASLAQDYSIGAIRIHVRVSELDAYIRIDGGTALDHILLTTGTQIYGFNWTTGKLEQRLALTAEGTLEEGFRQESVLVDGSHLLKAKSGRVSATASDAATPAQHVVSADALVWTSEDGFSVTLAAGAAPLLTPVPARDLTGFTQMDGLAHAVTEDAAAIWNATRTVEAAAISLFNPDNTAFVHRWAPRVFYPELGNPAPLPPSRGLFYGRHLPIDALGHILTYTPATEIRVSFGCYLDDRYVDDVNGVRQVRKGYCETVTKIVTAEEGDIPVGENDFLTCYFMPELWTPDRVTFYQRPALPAVGYIFGGASHQNSIPKELFLIDYQSFFTGVPTLHWWTARGAPYAPEVDAEARHPLHGVLAVSAGAWVLHTYRGNVTLRLQGTEYHSHSVSTNGSIVAVFMGAESIERVLVFDLMTYTTLREQEFTQVFTSGVVIPIAPAAEPVVPPLPTAISAFVDTSEPEMQSPLGGIIQIPTGQFDVPASVTGWKTIIDGKDAVCSVWEDPCWTAASITIIQPVDLSPAALLSTTYTVDINGQTITSEGWAGLGAKLPFLLWFASSVGLHNTAAMATWNEDTPEASGVSVGPELSMTVYQRATAIEISESESPSGIQLVPTGNAKAPLSWTASPAEAIVETLEGVFLNPNYSGGCKAASVQVVDVCGVSGELDLTGDDISPIGPLTANGIFDESRGCWETFGSQLQATGGLPPYTFYVTGGVQDDPVIDSRTGQPYINPDGFINSLPDLIEPLNSCAGGAGLTITVEDSCGNTGGNSGNGVITQCTPDNNPGIPVIEGPSTRVAGNSYVISNVAEVPALNDGGVTEIEWTLRTLTNGVYTDCGTIVPQGTGAQVTSFDGCGCDAGITFNGNSPEGLCISAVFPIPPEALSLTGATTNVAVDTQYTVSGGLGPYSWSITSGAIDSTGKITAVGCKSAGVDATVSVTDSCGTTATLDVEFTTPATLTVSGPVNGVIVGSDFNASGGSSPYTFSVNKGSINSSTGVITAVTCTTGTSAVVRVTVTDACGVTAYLDARYNTGSWVQIGATWTLPSCSIDLGSNDGISIIPPAQLVSVPAGNGWEYSTGKATRNVQTRFGSCCTCQTPPYPYPGTLSQWCTDDGGCFRLSAQQYYEWQCP